MNDKELLQKAHDLLDAANATIDSPSCRYCTAEGYNADGLEHDDDCIIIELRQALAPPIPPYSDWQPKEVYDESDLTFAAFVRCPCGAGMAYPKNVHWDCSDILMGLAIPSGQPGAVKHEGKLPFRFYEIKSEDQPSAEGATTRRRVVIQ